MITTASEQTLLRTHPQSSEVFLSIFQPRPAFIARVTGSISQGAQTIPYYNVTSGSFSAIEAGMTLLVGTTSGGRELGKIRVKSATSSSIVVAENSYIDWASATHLTVLRHWEMWPIFPYVISDPGNSENVIFYKDYDTAYTNQNSILGAFPCAGPNRAIFVGENVYYSSTGSYHLLGSNLSYEWAFEGGSPTGSTSAVPGNVQYNTAGHYVTRLKVTGANGTLDTTYRTVSVYNNPNSSSVNIPQTNWTLGNLSGSRAEGGYLLDITITEKDVSVNDGDEVVLFTNDFYGSTNTSIGGNHPNASKIFFSGYIVGSSIRYNYKAGSVSFQVASVTELMKKSEGFSISVESKASPTTWTELLDMDSRRALYHYLKWHSTALYMTDFAFVGQDQKIQYFDSDRESIFDAVDNYMRSALLGSVCADRQGKIWAEVGAWAVTNPTGSFPAVMSLQNQDWIGDVTVERNLSPTSSYLELGGVAYSGVVTGTFDALIAASPGSTPHVRGSVSRNQGMALGSQSQLNSIVGHQYANKNATFPTIKFNLNGKYSNFDIAPQEAVMVSATANETNIGVGISAPYLVEDMSWTYDPVSKTLLCTLGTKTLINGTAGQTVTIPDIPNTEGYGGDNFGGGLNFPPFALPPFLTSVGDAFVLKASSTTLSPAANQEGQFDYNTIEINYNSTFATYSGTADPSSAQSGTFVTYLSVPYTGIYLIAMTTNFNMVNGFGYAVIEVKRPGSSVWEEIDAQQNVDWDIDHPLLSTARGIVTEILEAGTIVGGAAMSNSTFSRSMSSTMNVILLARTG